MDSRALRELLLEHLAAGTLPASRVLHAVKELESDPPASPPSLQGLLAALDPDQLPTAARGQALRSLRHDVIHQLVSLAQEAQALRSSNRPIPQRLRQQLQGFEVEPVAPWPGRAKALRELGALLGLIRDRNFAVEHAEQLPELSRRLEERYQAALAVARTWDVPWSAVLPDAEPTTNQRELEQLLADFESAGSRADQQVILDRALAWPSDAICPQLALMCQEMWAQDRASVALALRFGQPLNRDWQAWKVWLDSWQREIVHDRHALGPVDKTYAAELAFLHHELAGDADANRSAELEAACQVSARDIDPRGLARRFKAELSVAERLFLMSGAQAAAQPPEAQPAAAEPAAAEPPSPAPATPPDASALPEDAPPPQVRPDEQPADPSPPVRQPEPEIQRRPEVVRKEPAGPTVWQDHLRPFFLENWYIVAGILMLVVGSSLVAYFTWDRHWAVRYTILPAMLGGFTVGLAWLGSWLERKEEQFRDTAAILRGAAIGLLPVNFMTVAFLGDDPDVVMRLPIVLAVATFYLVVFGLGLRRWCAAVHPSLGMLLGGSLLVLNALVTLRPIAESLSGGEPRHLPLILGTGFHLGFGFLALAVLAFTNRVLTRELAESRRVVWFFGATLAVTFLQVFAWVHASFGRLPQVFTYAPMLILTGGLVLHVERRAQEMRGEEAGHGGESFLGFALILLGCLMAQANDAMRIAGFVLAGLVWLYEASARRHPAHDWIGVMLLTLGVGSMGLLPNFPKTALPAVGLGLALGLDVMRLLLRPIATERPGLLRAAAGVRNATLFFTVVLAVLVQWHFKSDQLWTAGYLLATAGYFLLRANREQQLAWLHAGMVVLAVALPYIGCVDMGAERSLHGNTMVFGLAVLSLGWLLFNWWTPTTLSRQARSTVLWTYGALAVVGMVLRVVLEDRQLLPADLEWHRVTMDYVGPLMMAGCLVFATWFSRSLIPAGMAAVIVIILFPELKARYSAVFEQLGWGSGMGSAVSALVITLGCFWLRTVAWLKDLSEGDRFLDRSPFPLRRFDHTLFTLPLLASAVFLIAKTDTLTLFRNLTQGTLGAKTAIAVLLTGATWTLLSVYFRKHRAWRFGVHLGWLALMGSMLLFWRVACDVPGPDPHLQWPFFNTLLVLTVLVAGYRFVLEPRRPWAAEVVTAPTLKVLESLSVVLGISLFLALFGDSSARELLPLTALVAVHLAWHETRTRSYLHGGLLFAMMLLWLLSWHAPGSERLLARLSLENGAWPLLGYALGIQALLVVTETMPRLRRPGRTLLQSLEVGVVAVTVAMSLVLAGDYLRAHVLTTTEDLALVLTLLLAARSAGSGGILLLAFGAAYVAMQAALLHEDSSFPQRIAALTSPWRLALFATILPVACGLGRLLHARLPRLLVGPDPLFRQLLAPTHWLLGPAAAIAGLAVLYHTVNADLREQPVQLWAPYLGALSFGLVGWMSRKWGFYGAAGVAVTLGNVHFVRVMWGDWLLDQGLSPMHLVGLGLVISLVMVASVRPLLRRLDQAQNGLDQASILIAGLVLLLLAANYLVNPNLAEVSTFRFLVSGVMAYIAGLSFRRVARHAGPERERLQSLLEGGYHFAVTVALWCAALMIPALREPNLALLALSLPAYYFATRAELGYRSGLPSAPRYRLSAAAVGFAILILYASKGLFHLVLFPDVPVDTSHYHINSPSIMALGLVLLRLHALGGTPWLAFYGGLSMILGSFFLLTWFPKLSPFQNIVPATWCAVVLGHFWTMVGYQRSPLRAGIQSLAGATEEEWAWLHRSWGYCLLAASQAVVLAAVLDADTVARGLPIAPLILGAATVWIHHGALRGSPIYLAVAGVELLAALHAGFVVESYLPGDQVIWVLLLLWVAVLALHRTLGARLKLSRMDNLIAGFTTIVVLHVLYHGPASSTGLWAMAAVGVLGSLTPLTADVTRRDRFAASLLLLVPTWLAYFSQCPASAATWFKIPLANNGWPYLAAATALLLTGGAARLMAGKALSPQLAETSRPRLIQQLLQWFVESGHRIFVVFLGAASLVVVALQALHWGRAFENGELVLLCFLHASFCALWFVQARQGPTIPHRMAAYLGSQLFFLLVFLSIRHHLQLTTNIWRLEYDIWASLLTSLLLVGARQVFDLRPKELQVPFTISILALPAFSLAWTLANDLGTDVTLIVVGLHSLMFSFLGKDNRESPYHLAAIAGFVAFVLIVFWSKLDLRTMQAYVIPVGLGILVLLQMFRHRVAAATRNRVRLVTLLAMLGSAAYYALVDPRYPVVFNLTLLVLCLLAMGLGSFLRVRMYLVLGFTGVLVNLGSIVYRSFSGMERATRMTSVGVLVLLLGAALVIGAIYYKTHKDAINKRLDGWRRRFGEWE